jgi:hypothetical protein
VLKKGDRIVAVGTGVMLERFEQIVGRRSGKSGTPEEWWGN